MIVSMAAIERTVSRHSNAPSPRALPTLGFLPTLRAGLGDTGRW
jgi:hypothetical protein